MSSVAAAEEEEAAVGPVAAAAAARRRYWTACMASGSVRPRQLLLRVRQEDCRVSAPQQR